MIALTRCARRPLGSASARPARSTAICSGARDKHANLATGLRRYPSPYSYPSPCRAETGVSVAMNITRVITASVISAGVAAGFASPARADDAAPQVPETYTFKFVGADLPTTWTVTHCGTLCTHIEDSGNANNAPWQSDAYLLNGYWTMFIHRTDMIACGDGGENFPADAQYNWDASLHGIASASTGGVCGDPPAPVQAQFTLTRVS